MALDISSKEFLVIDDYGDMRGVIRNMLQSFGAERIDTCANGKDAIKMMEQKRYDVVLCDYNLGPGRDGQQVLEEVRHRDLIGVGALFVMVTAENTREMVMGAVEYEPDSYLTKPFTKDLLEQRLQRLMIKKMNLRDVDAAVSHKHYDDAISLLNSKIIDFPNSAKDFTRLKGELLMKSGIFDQAEKLYNEVLEEREIGWARIGLGKTYYEAERYPEAKDVFEQLIEDNERLMAGYDWLAKTCQEMGDSDQAQQVLERAAELSPKATLRQRNLGDLAQQNGDDKTAIKAYEMAISKGRHSIYKQPAIYANLAQSKARTDSPDEAMKVLRNLKRDYIGNSEAALYSAMTETVLYQDMGQADKAQQAMAEAEELFAAMGDEASPAVSIGMAKACSKMGDDQRAEQILHQAVRNNHEERDVLREVGAAMTGLGFSNSVEMIESIKKEVVRMNNEGVKLAKEGKLEEAVGLFEEAAEAMAANKVVNLNAARVLMMYLEKTGVTGEGINKVRDYLERVKRIDPGNSTLASMQQRFHKLQNG